MRGPPHPDDNEDAFPTKFILACSSTTQLQHLTPCRCTLSEFFAPPKEGQDVWFYNTFARPIPGTKRVQHHHPQPGKSLSYLECLPTELVEVLLDILLISSSEELSPNMKSTLGLALSSPVLYPKVLARIHRDYVRCRISSWAGKEIGFYGAHSHLTPQQTETWNPANYLQYWPGSGEKWWVGYENVRGAGEDLWLEALEGVKGIWKGVEWEDVRRDLSEGYLYELEQGGVWVLRNITTKEIVRSDGLVPAGDIIQDEMIKVKAPRLSLWERFCDRLRAWKSSKVQEENKALAPLSLAQIFLVLTAHTACLHWWDENIGFTRGPWVNHAFELLSLDGHLAPSSDVEWTDVSVQVAADVGHLRWCMMQNEVVVQQLRIGIRRADFIGYYERVAEGRKVWTKWRPEKVVPLGW